MAQPFLNQCAALRIKPNSSVLEHEAELLQAKVVDLTNNYVGGGGLQALTDILRRNTKLESLILHSNGLSNEAVVFLCRALRGHATLKRIDLSGNPISLPAGLALLQHVHAASGIEDINLDGTLIDELIIRKIQRSININRGSRVARAAPSVVATLASINAEFAEKREVAEKAKRIRAEVAEQLSGSAMRELAAKATLPPRDPESGWLVINVYASTTPGDFCSELELLETDVIPKLNDAFRARKTHFVLTSLYNGLTPKQRAKMPKTCHADVQQALLKAPTVFLQFLGDKVGEFADAVGEQTPLQEFERDSTPAAQRGMRLFLVRQCAKLLKLPAALMPLFSDDPQLVFPDATTSIVRNALLDARGLPRPPAFDPKVAHERYARLLAAKTAIAETPQKFVSLGYTAEFAAVDADGNVRLAKLAALGAGLVRRVSAFVDLLLARANEVSVRDVQRTVDARAALLPGRKSLTGKLDLYCVTPPSRNALLLAHEPGAGATTLLHALNCRLEKRAGFVVASHYVRDPLLSAQSRDAKAMFLSLSQALLTAHAQIVAQAAAAEAERTGVPAAAVAPGAMRSKLKSSVLDDLDVASAKSLFVSTLHDVASDVLAKSIVVVVLIDGVDFIEFPDAACDALRRHEATGADDWPSTDPAAAAATLKAALSASAVGEGAGGASSSLSARAAPSYVDDLDWIPTCLAKNVRFVLSCHAGSRAHQTLEVRGHDSCDVVVVSELGDADFEAIVGKSCELAGVDAATEMDLAAIRGKAGQYRSPQYLQFVMQAMLTAQLTPQYMKRATALATVPDNIDRCCDALLDRFEAEFGLPLASLVSTSLACAARLGGGILDVHLREMMQRLRIARSAGRKSAGPDGASIASSSSSSAASASSSSVTPLINTNEFERVLRVLRPVLDGGTALATAMCNTGTNLGPLSATFHIVSARCTHFTDCVRRRYLPTLDAAGAAHRAMAHFYMRHCAHHDPFQAMAIRAAAFHIVESGLWATLEERVMSLPFVAMVMRRRQAPAVFAQLVRAYNTLQPIVAAATAAAATRAAIIGGGGAGAAAASAASATSSTGAGAAASAGSAKLVPAPPAGTNKKPARPTVGGAPTTPATPVVTAASNNNNNNSNAAAPALAHAQVALLQLLREYIYFIRRHFRALNAVPHLVAQVAILLPVDSALHIAASELLAKRGVGRLVPVLGRTRNANLHHALVSACQFTPSGLRIASGAHDGTVKVCNVMGEVVHTIRDAADKVNFVRYSQTSRYIVAASENHVVLVIDAASGQTVSKIQGHAGTVRCIAMTARGRNVLVGYEDRELWVWDSETGRHVSTIGHHAIAPQGSQFGGVNGIIPHPTDERIVYTICERRLLGSRILHAEAEGQPQFESTLNIVAHNTQPLAADSCFVVCDGSFALLCARDLVAQPPTFVRSEANVKIVSLHTGRMIAALVMELGCAGNRPSAVCAIVSPDERWIVTGALDGAMRVYQPDWRTYATIDDAGLPEPTSVRPARVMRGFDDAPPRLMRFAFDSKSFIATCGSVARVWPVQAAAAAANTAAKTLAQQSDDGMMAGCDVEARIEFVTPGATITCCDWSPNPSDDGAQIVIGDDRGKLYCLREESA